MESFNRFVFVNALIAMTNQNFVIFVCIIEVEYAIKVQTEDSKINAYFCSSSTKLYKLDAYNGFVE